MPKKNKVGVSGLSFFAGDSPLYKNISEGDGRVRRITDFGGVPGISVVPDVRDITNDTVAVQNENGDRHTVYLSPSGRIYDSDQPVAYLGDARKMNFAQLRRVLGSDYIGGKTPGEVRVNALAKVPQLSEIAEKAAVAHDVDKDVFFRRLIKEGLADQIAKEYNKRIPSEQRTYLDNFVYMPVDGAYSLGLDRAGDLLLDGKISPAYPETQWEYKPGKNAKNENFVSVVTPDFRSAMDLKGAVSSYNRSILKKRGMDDPVHLNASYNLGPFHKDLSNNLFIQKNYSVPSYNGLLYNNGRIPYYLDASNIEASGGKIHIKPENRGKFTALKERTGHSATWFKEHGTPAQKKMATFALNARKWKHADGGFLHDPDAKGYMNFVSSVPGPRSYVTEPRLSVLPDIMYPHYGFTWAGRRYVPGPKNISPWYGGPSTSPAVNTGGLVKYSFGGIMDKMNNVYNGDRDAMLSAVRKAMLNKL